MKEVVMNRYLKLFDLLDLESKLELLSKLTENINRTSKEPNQNKMALLEELSGVWSNMDDSLVKDIYTSRSTSNKIIDFDN